ncbi:MAG: hypothetical protein KGI83_00905, partial [Verrucomicrobiota bacterium]|nr:hypothetical protein [Verrucomicrobiota bacterium]
MYATAWGIRRGPPPYVWRAGGPIVDGADAPALGFSSQRENAAQARARFGRGGSALHTPEPSTRFIE